MFGLRDFSTKTVLSHAKKRAEPVGAPCQKRFPVLVNLKSGWLGCRCHAAETTPYEKLVWARLPQIRQIALSEFFQLILNRAGMAIKAPQKGKSHSRNIVVADEGDLFSVG